MVVKQHCLGEITLSKTTRPHWSHKPETYGSTAPTCQAMYTVGHKIRGTPQVTATMASNNRFYNFSIILIVNVCCTQP